MKHVYAQLVISLFFGLTLMQPVYGMRAKRKFEDTQEADTKKMREESRLDIVRDKGLRWYVLRRKFPEVAVDLITEYARPPIPEECFFKWAYWWKRLRIPVVEVDKSSQEIKNIISRFPPLPMPYYIEEHVLVRYMSDEKYRITVEPSEQESGTLVKVYDMQNNQKLVGASTIPGERVEFITIDPSHSWFAYVCTMPQRNYSMSLRSINIVQISTLKPILTDSAGMLDCWDWPDVRIGFNPDTRAELFAHSIDRHPGTSIVKEEKINKFDLTALDRFEKIIQNPTLEEAHFLHSLWNNEEYDKAERSLGKVDLAQKLTSTHFKLLTKRASFLESLSKKK